MAMVNGIQAPQRLFEVQSLKTIPQDKLVGESLISMLDFVEPCLISGG